jgi:hypothetical protein
VRPSGVAVGLVLAVRVPGVPLPVVAGVLVLAARVGRQGGDRLPPAGRLGGGRPAACRLAARPPVPRQVGLDRPDRAEVEDEGSRRRRAGRSTVSTSSSLLATIAPRETTASDATARAVTTGALRPDDTRGGPLRLEGG